MKVGKKVIAGISGMVLAAVALTAVWPVSGERSLLSQSGTYFVQRQGSYVLVDRKGQQLSNAVGGFDFVNHDCPWPVPARTYRGWVYVKQDGNLLTEAMADMTYRSASCFSDGWAVATMQDHRPVFLTLDGKQHFSTLKVPYRPAFMSHGVVTFRVCEGDLCEAVFVSESTGRPLADGGFSHAGVFNEGLAYVTRRNWPGYTYMTPSGDLIGPPIFKAAGTFSEGFAAAAGSDLVYGFIDKKGQWVIPPKFKKAGRFSEGLAGVLLPEGWGYIDKRGTVVIAGKWRSAGMFQNGLARVEGEAGAYYIDKRGEVAFRGF